MSIMRSRPRCQHRGVDISEDDLCPTVTHQARLFERQVAGATGQVEHPVTGSQATHFERKAFPQMVNAERHDVVHQVVFFGDRGKYFGNAILLIGGRNVFETEVGSGFILHGANLSTCQ